MIRCRAEVEDRVISKKHEDSRESFVIVPRRMTFDELVRRDGERWRRIDDAGELKRAMVRAGRELRAGQMERFAAWIASHLRAGVVRAAGLAPLRVQLAS